MRTSTRVRLIAGAAILAFIGLAYSNAQEAFPLPKAQTPKGGPQKHYSLINCSALKGAPQVCVSNNTDDMITDIDCETKGFFGGTGAKAVEMPKGGIPPHSITIVNMKSCNTTLVFTVLGGGERKVPNVHTDQATLIEVPQQ